MTTYDPAGDGTCQSATPAGSATWTYDSADRATTTGYDYDALGRTVSMPGSDTAVAQGGVESLTYHSNDMVRVLSQNGRTNVYTLDVLANRVRSWTDDASGAVVTKVNHFSDDGDSPAWTDEGNLAISRIMNGLGGMAGVQTSVIGRTWTIVNLHGDLVAGMSDSGTGLAYTSEYDESGKPRNPADAGARRYGWVGAAQRAADTPGGLTLMGERLYAPGSGRFLSVDPVDGGNANPYEYCRGSSPNCSDTDGNISCYRYAMWTSFSLFGKPLIHRFRAHCTFSNWTVLGIIAGWGVFGAALSLVGAVLAVIPATAAAAPWVTIAARAIQFMAAVAGAVYLWLCRPEGMWENLLGQEHRLCYWCGIWLVDWAVPTGIGCNRYRW
jgi:RHS repeat-associated protein